MQGFGSSGSNRTPELFSRLRCLFFRYGTRPSLTVPTIAGRGHLRFRLSTRPQQPIPESNFGQIPPLPPAQHPSEQTRKSPDSNIGSSVVAPPIFTNLRLSVQACLSIEKRSGMQTCRQEGSPNDSRTHPKRLAGISLHARFKKRRMARREPSAFRCGTKRQRYRLRPEADRVTLVFRASSGIVVRV